MTTDTIATLPAPELIELPLLASEGRLQARASLLGSRIALRDIAGSAGSVAAGRVGRAVVLRYGAMVAIGADPDAEQALRNALAPHVSDPLAVPETETLALRIDPDAEERIEPDGTLVLRAADAQRLQLVAIVLARSVALAHDEARLVEVFDTIEPVIAELSGSGRVRFGIGGIMRQSGSVLASYHRIAGRMQVTEKPDLLWDHPDLDRLYARLEAEYELGDRARAFERKLELVGDTVDRLLDIAQNKRTVRLELAIIALFTFEIVIGLWNKLP